MGWLVTELEITCKSSANLLLLHTMMLTMLKMLKELITGETEFLRYEFVNYSGPYVFLYETLYLRLQKTRLK